MFDINIRYFNRKNADGSTSFISAMSTMLSIPFSNQNSIYINNPVLKLDMAAIGSFDFELEPTSPYYDSFLQLKTIVQVIYDGTTIFYGRVLNIQNTFWGNRKISCEDALAYLGDAQAAGVEDKSRVQKNLSTYISELINVYNTQCNTHNTGREFAIGNMPGSYTNDARNEQRIDNAFEKHDKSSWDSVKDRFDDLASSFGGYFRTRYQGGRIYLDWFKHYFNAVKNAQPIRVGKNLIDQNNSYEVDNIFTAIIPIGSNEDQVVTIDGYQTDHHSGNYIKVSDLVNIFTSDKLNEGYHTVDDYASAESRYGMIFKTVTFPNADTQAKLWEYAIDWLKNNYVGSVNDFTIKAVDMHQVGKNVQKHLVGDRVLIEYPVYFNNRTTITDDPAPNQAQSKIERKELTIKQITYDLFNPENTQYTIGIPSDLLDHEYGEKNTKAKKANPSSGSSEIPTYTPPSSGGGPSTININIHKEIRGTFPYNPWRQMFGYDAYDNYVKHHHYAAYTVAGALIYHIASFRLKNGDQYYVGVFTGGIFVHASGNTGVVGWIQRGNLVYFGNKKVCYDLSKDMAKFLRDADNDDISVTPSPTKEDESGSGSSPGPGNPNARDPKDTTRGLYQSPEGLEYYDYPDDPSNPNSNKPSFDIIGPGKEDPIISLDVETGKSFFGRDNNGNPLVTLNDTITYTDVNGITQTVNGAISVQDLNLPEIPSFRTKIAQIDNLVATKATINELRAYEALFGDATKAYDENGDFIGFDGTALKVSAEQLVAVKGVFQVDKTTGKITIIDGGGVNIKRDGVEYGLFDDGTLSGGVIVEKMEDGTVQTKISGRHIAIGDKNSTVSINDVLNVYSGGIMMTKKVWFNNSSGTTIDGGTVAASSVLSSNFKITSASSSGGQASSYTLDGTNVPYLVTGILYSNGQLTLTQLNGTSTPIGTIIDASIVNGNTLRLTKVSGNGGQTSTINFNKATTLTGAWSSSNKKFTVNATQTMNGSTVVAPGTGSISTTLQSLSPTGDVTTNTTLKVVSQTMQVMSTLNNETESSQKVAAELTAVINASEMYLEGQKNATIVMDNFTFNNIGSDPNAYQNVTSRTLTANAHISQNTSNKKSKNSTIKVVLSGHRVNLQVDNVNVASRSVEEVWEEGRNSVPSTSIDSSDIHIGSISCTNTSPRSGQYSANNIAYYTLHGSGRYVYFTVEIDGTNASRTYYIDRNS